MERPHAKAGVRALAAQGLTPDRGEPIVLRALGGARGSARRTVSTPRRISVTACHLRAGQLADRRPSAWRLYGNPAVTRALGSRPAQTTGEGPAALGKVRPA